MNEYIIINKSTIQQKIEELEKELTYHQEWYKKARENYDRNREFWGNADDGEIRTASEAVSTTAREIKILKQILSQSTPLIPVLEQSYFEGECYGIGTDACITKEDCISNLRLDI